MAAVVSTSDSEQQSTQESASTIILQRIISNVFKENYALNSRFVSYTSADEVKVPEMRMTSNISS